MDDCIFCRIVKGEIPSAKVYEDDGCYAFLDIGPLSWGHTLVIPKKHYEHVTEMPAAELAALMSVVPKLAAAVIRATDAEGLNVLQNNGRVAHQFVPHVHFHVIPRNPGDEFHFNWPAGRYPPGRAEQLAQAIRANL